MFSQYFAKCVFNFEVAVYGVHGTQQTNVSSYLHVIVVVVALGVDVRKVTNLVGSDTANVVIGGGEGLVARWASLLLVGPLYDASHAVTVQALVQIATRFHITQAYRALRLSFLQI